MSKTLVVFSHGKESGPFGSKIVALMNVAGRMGADTLSIDYNEYPAGVFHDHDAPGQAERRVAQLVSIVSPVKSEIVLVGSSMGGYVSAVASEKVKPKGIFLMAPAFYIPGYVHQEPKPSATKTMVVHGWRDSVVPAEHSLRYAAKYGCDLHVLDGDHRLNDSLPKIELLFESFLVELNQLW